MSGPAGTYPGAYSSALGGEPKAPGELAEVLKALEVLEKQLIILHEDLGTIRKRTLGDIVLNSPPPPPVAPENFEDGIIRRIQRQIGRLGELRIADIQKEVTTLNRL